jgi:glycerol-3-phosphate dehydrogenase (NAD(P)+)
VSDTPGDKVAIIGGGSWGTALACALARGGETALWVRGAEQAETMLRTRHNPRYLEEVELPQSILITGDLGLAVVDAPLIIMAVPARGMAVTTRGVSAVLRSVRGPGGRPPLVLSAAKGLDPETGRLMSEVLRDALGDRAVIGALSGPNIALEVGRGLPTATVVACNEGMRAEEAQRRVSGTRLRAYTNNDVTGVEVGGALKNVIALAAGISDGMGAGDNAKAAIMTRGLAEMTRLGVALGGRQSTFSGLTGLGDLIVTCSSPHSRNRAIGIGIGSGKSLVELEGSMTMVAEGVNTTREALRLGLKHRVELPIAEAVAAVLFRGADPISTAASLMARSGKAEIDFA